MTSIEVPGWVLWVVIVTVALAGVVPIGAASAQASGPGLGPLAAALLATRRDRDR